MVQELLVQEVDQELHDPEVVQELQDQEVVQELQNPDHDQIQSHQIVVVRILVLLISHTDRKLVVHQHGQDLVVDQINGLFFCNVFIFKMITN